MKKLNELAWNVPEEEYRADTAYSYSTIAKYSREGFKGLPTLFDKVESPSLLFGSLVDTLLTDRDSFNGTYLVASLPKITDSLMPIAKELTDSYSHLSSFTDIPDVVLAEVGERHGYYKDPKYKNHRVKLIKEGCAEYFDLAKKSIGKTIVSRELVEEAEACVQELLTNDYTASIFAPPVPELFNVEKFYQLKFKGKYKGIDIRGMLDLVIVDHDKKLIIPVDLKTSSKPEYEFPYSFVQWRYFLQSNLYTELLKQNVLTHEDYKDYKIGKYLFVVISRHTKTPMVWCDSTNHSLINPTYNDAEYKGWRELVIELDNELMGDKKYPLWAKKINDISEYFNG